MIDTEDLQIIQLFLQRAETAVHVLQEQYGRFCCSVASRVLTDRRDVEECLSDTYLRVWNAIPPERPNCLPAYLARITRNLALDRYAYNTAEKRSTALTTAFEELEQFIPSAKDDPAKATESREFAAFINRFLGQQSQEARIFFVRRYWYGENIGEIAKACQCGEEKVKTSLFRTRNKLRFAMEKEEIYL